GAANTGHTRRSFGRAAISDGTADRDPTPVRIEIIGALAVVRGSSRLAGRDLASRKGRTLLALLAVRRGVVVPVDGIIEALWRDEPPPKARENVSSLVSRPRATPGQAAVEPAGEGYRLALGAAGPGHREPPAPQDDKAE